MHRPTPGAPAPDRSDTVPSLLRSALRARDWDAVTALAVAHAGHSCLRLPTAAGGLSALHLAALAGAADAVDALLSAGADADARDARGQTPLHAAAGAGQLSAVERLLASGAVPRVNDAGKTPLHDAAWAGHVEVARALLGHVDVDVVGEDGRSALHCASLARDPALVERLVGAGASLSKVDAQGKTPLDWAKAFGSAAGVTAVADVLENAGALPAAAVNSREVPPKSPKPPAPPNAGSGRQSPRAGTRAGGVLGK